MNIKLLFITFFFGLSVHGQFGPFESADLLADIREDIVSGRLEKQNGPFEYPDLLADFREDVMSGRLETQPVPVEENIASEEEILEAQLIRFAEDIVSEKPSNLQIRVFYNKRIESDVISLNYNGSPRAFPNAIKSLKREIAKKRRRWSQEAIYLSVVHILSREENGWINTEYLDLDHNTLLLCGRDSKNYYINARHFDNREHQHPNPVQASDSSLNTLASTSANANYESNPSTTREIFVFLNEFKPKNQRFIRFCNSGDIDQIRSNLSAEISKLTGWGYVCFSLYKLCSMSADQQTLRFMSVNFNREFKKYLENQKNYYVIARERHDL